MNKIRIAVIGLAHIHYITLMRDFKKYEDKFTFVGMADYPPYTEEEVKTRIKMNVPPDLYIPFWDDYKELLRQDIQAAIICTDVKDHAAAAEEVLSMGIHTIVEKPMALDMEDAKRMYRASKRSAARLFINWPVAWMGAFRKVKELASGGAAGDILRIHYRSPATCGPYKVGQYSADELSKLWWYRHERGGGSICDYAGYGCVLTTWIAQKTAKRVSGIKKNFLIPFSDAEDYALFAIDFGSTVGLVEGSWSTLNSGEIPTGPIVYGSKGVIVSDRYSNEVKLYSDITSYDGAVKPTKIYTADDNGDCIALNVINFINSGIEPFEMTTPEFNMKAMAAFDAGRRSCETGNTENAKDPFQF